MIIDGHAHTGGEFYDVEKLVAILDNQGVDKIVLCPGQVNHRQGHSVPELARVIPRIDPMLFINRVIRFLTAFTGSDEDLSQRNELVYSMVQQYPDRIIQFLWVDPNAPAIIDYLEKRLAIWKFNGIKLHQCIQRFSLKSQSINDIIQWANENKLPVFIHLYAHHEVEALTSLLKTYSQTNFIVGHLIGLERFIENRVRSENLYYDISPFALISDLRIKKAVSTFGAEHLTFGSDTPYGSDNLKNNLSRVSHLKMSARDKELILGGNMQRILNL